MTTNTTFWRFVAAALVLAAPSLSFAQRGQFGGGYGPPLKAEKPPKEFATSDEHYEYLLAQAKGGTKHTLATVPRWDGIWNTAGNTHLEVFIDGPGGLAGKVREGVLTPAYEKAYKERWRQQTEEGQVHYDRLAHCEPPGMPRFLLEPYTHEFINLPQESYLINDFGPSIRRVLIGKKHSNLYGTHSWYGDTIGFWDGDKLVLNSKYLYPADFTRWSPMTSNQFESVEIWQLQEIPEQRRAPRGAGHVLRQVCVREAGQCRVRVPPRSRTREGRLPDQPLGVRAEHQRVSRRQGRVEFPSARRERVQRCARLHDVPGASRPDA